MNETRITPRSFGISAVLAVTLIWSFGTILFKSVLEMITPLSLTAYQIVLAAIVMFLACLMRPNYRAELRRIDRHAGFKLLGMGISRYTIGLPAMFAGLRLLPANTSALISSFSVIVVVIIGLVVLREHPRPLQAFGILIALMGTFIYFGATLDDDQWLGILYSLVSVLGFSIYNILSRSLGRNRRFGNLVLTAYSMALGLPLLLVITWLVDGPPNWAMFEGLPLAAILWGGLLDNSLGQFLWNWALGRLLAFEVSALSRAKIVEISLLANWLLREKVSLRQWLGILTTIVGIVLSQTRKDKERM